jgi:hypothetical protein
MSDELFADILFSRREYEQMIEAAERRRRLTGHPNIPAGRLEEEIYSGLYLIKELGFQCKEEFEKIGSYLLNIKDEYYNGRGWDEKNLKAWHNKFDEWYKMQRERYEKKRKQREEYLEKDEIQWHEEKQERYRNTEALEKSKSAGDKHFGGASPLASRMRRKQNKRKTSKNRSR